MASTFTGLGTQLMTTGEKAGTWGTLTNTNWNIAEQIAGGYLAVDINGGAQTTTLAVNDGTTGAALAHRILEFTGAITGNQIVTIPLDVQTFYILKNTTSDGTNGYTVQFKYVTGSGSSVTFAGGDRGTKIVYAGGVGDDVTNPNIVDATSALSLTSPSVITGINDVIGNELVKVTATASAINELTIANAATGNGPIISTTGGDAAVDLNLNPKGAGVLKSGTAAVKIAGTETIWIPAVAMYGSTTNPADAQQVETTALRPDLKVLDYDASTSEFAQFAVTFPKSWNGGTVTFIPTWSPGNTDTGNCIWSLSGLSVAEGETADTAFSGAQTSTDAGIGTVEDIQMGPVSSAITIAGTIADGNQVFFQLERDADNVSDTFTGDARLLGIQLFYTTDAANDA